MMSPTVAILVWWVAFGGTHTLLSALTIRRRLIAFLGERGFILAYSLVSFATFIPLVRVYLANVHAGAYVLPISAWPGLRQVALLVGGLSFACAIGGLFQPSALSLGGGKAAEARGLARITRHPLFMFLGVWALAHVVTNGFASDLAFFGGFAVYTVIGCAHQDARKRVTDGDRLGQYFAETSLIPFAAIASGRNQMVWRELPWAGLGVGALAATAIYLLHPWLFGR